MPVKEALSLSSCLTYKTNQINLFTWFRPSTTPKAYSPFKPPSQHLAPGAKRNACWTWSGRRSLTTRPKSKWPYVDRSKKVAKLMKQPHRKGRNSEAVVVQVRFWKLSFNYPGRNYLVGKFSKLTSYLQVFDEIRRKRHKCIKWAKLPPNLSETKIALYKLSRPAKRPFYEKSKKKW